MINEMEDFKAVAVAGTAAENEMWQLSEVISRK